MTQANASGDSSESSDSGLEYRLLCRAAKAICASDGNLWSLLSVENQERYRRRAEAALKVLGSKRTEVTEVTETMKSEVAGDAPRALYEHDKSRHFLKEHWPKWDNLDQEAKAYYAQAVDVIRAADAADAAARADDEALRLPSDILERAGYKVNRIPPVGSFRGVRVELMIEDELDETSLGPNGVESLRLRIVGSTRKVSLPIPAPWSSTWPGRTEVV